jgi:hypothetical protein
LSSKINLGAVIAAIFIVGAATAPLATAAPADDACSLLTQAQVSAALGVSVGAGSYESPTFKKTCRWTVAGGAGPWARMSASSSRRGMSRSRSRYTAARPSTKRRLSRRLSPRKPFPSSDVPRKRLDLHLPERVVDLTVWHLSALDHCVPHDVEASEDSAFLL